MASIVCRLLKKWISVSGSHLGWYKIVCVRHFRFESLTFRDDIPLGQNFYLITRVHASEEFTQHDMHQIQIILELLDCLWPLRMSSRLFSNSNFEICTQTLQTLTISDWLRKQAISFPECEISNSREYKANMLLLTHKKQSLQSKLLSWCKFWRSGYWDSCNVQSNIKILMKDMSIEETVSKFFKVVNLKTSTTQASYRFAADELWAWAKQSFAWKRYKCCALQLEKPLLEFLKSGSLVQETECGVCIAGKREHTSNSCVNFPLSFKHLNLSFVKIT